MAEDPDAGIYGAKISGGGSGGTVVVLGKNSAGPAIDRVVTEFEHQHGYRPRVFAGSSDGALAFGLGRV